MGNGVGEEAIIPGGLDERKYRSEVGSGVVWFNFKTKMPARLPSGDFKKASRSLRLEHRERGMCQG